MKWKEMTLACQAERGSVLLSASWPMTRNGVTLTQSRCTPNLLRHLQILRRLKILWRLKMSEGHTTLTQSSCTPDLDTSRRVWTSHTSLTRAFYFYMGTQSPLGFPSKLYTVTRILKGFRSVQQPLSRENRLPEVEECTTRHLLYSGLSTACKALRGNPFVMSQQT